MVRARMLLALVAALVLSACATSRPSMSYVAKEVTAADAQILAADAVAHLADPLPPAHTTLVLDPPATATQDVLTEAMVSALRARGYGVTLVDPKIGTASDHETPLRYLASPLDQGVVLRLQYQGIEASRFYPRATDGKLLSNGAPFTVRGS